MVDLTLGTILAQMLNFFILVWILARFAYKPLVSMMQERKERIAKDLADAQAARNEAEQFKADYAAQIANARQEAQQIVLYLMLYSLYLKKIKKKLMIMLHYYMIRLY